MRGNLFENIPSDMPEEVFETICSTGAARIERIVSRGQASPEGFWYDQERDEFVLIMKGSAGIRIKGEDALVILKTGDYLNIGARVKHRVEWTDPDEETIWLAVHY